MPWHDVHCVVYGEVARDIATNFIARYAKITNKKQCIRSAIIIIVTNIMIRWNHHMEKTNTSSVPYLTPLRDDLPPLGSSLLLSSPSPSPSLHSSNNKSGTSISGRGKRKSISISASNNNFSSDDSEDGYNRRTHRYIQS